jgi:hypothetical protein
MEQSVSINEETQKLNLVSYEALEELNITPDEFVRYINERKYAASINE